jgi:hypothetical protein
VAAISDYLENALINAVLRNTAYTSPATVYLALYTTATTDAGGGTEVTGGSYARQAVTFGAPSNGVSTNSAAVSFTGMPAATVTHAGIRDALTGGNLLFHGALTASKTVGAGDTLTFAIGDISASIA